MISLYEFKVILKQTSDSEYTILYEILRIIFFNKYFLYTLLQIQLVQKCQDVQHSALTLPGSPSGRHRVGGALASESSHEERDSDDPLLPLRPFFLLINEGGEFCPQPGSLTILGSSHW